MEEAVLGNEDLVQIILNHAVLRPSTFVVASRVCKTWRSACLRDDSLLIKAATKSKYMTKNIVMGLFVLSSAEANQLPRTVCPRYAGGVMYRYDPSQILPEALEMVGGMTGMTTRLKKRARDQASIEAAFGENWRQLQWPKIFLNYRKGPNERGGGW
jgi:hypothetical protein